MVTSDAMSLERELQETRAELKKHVDEAKALQGVVTRLLPIGDGDQFWRRVDQVLDEIGLIIGAMAGVIFVKENVANSEFAIKAVAGLPRDFIERAYPGSDPTLFKVLSAWNPTIVSFDPTIENSICFHVGTYHQAIQPNKVALVPFGLSGEQNAMMIFFTNEIEDAANSLRLQDELPLLTLLAPQISYAFEKHEYNAKIERLKERELDVARQKDLWFEDVSHQLISPLNGLQADADRLIRHYEQWDAVRILNQLKAIQSIARYATRLTRNFDWKVRTGVISQGGFRRRWVRLKPYLIRCAIDLQGLAAKKGGRLHVDETVQESWEVWIEPSRFNQAIANLFDNAVKYGDPNTDVTVSGELTDSELHIFITNYGIPIQKSDGEKIFEREYRTEAAKKRVVVGTGIGLSIAREIVRLNDGNIRVASSTFDDKMKAHKVSFVVSLPIHATRS